MGFLCGPVRFETIDIILTYSIVLFYHVEPHLSWCSENIEGQISLCCKNNRKNKAWGWFSTFSCFDVFALHPILSLLWRSFFLRQHSPAGETVQFAIIFVDERFRGVLAAEDTVARDVNQSGFSLHLDANAAKDAEPQEDVDGRERHDVRDELPHRPAWNRWWLPALINKRQSWTPLQIWRTQVALPAEVLMRTHDFLWEDKGHHFPGRTLLTRGPWGVNPVFVWKWSFRDHTSRNLGDEHANKRRPGNPPAPVQNGPVSHPVWFLLPIRGVTHLLEGTCVDQHQQH